MSMLHIAGPDDLERLLPMVAGFQDHIGQPRNAEALEQALSPLLEGTPLGVVYLIGPRRAPVGYIALSFGWSIGFGGLEARISQFWVRSAVRGRGMGGDVLLALVPALAKHGLAAISLELPESDVRAQSLYLRRGFRAESGTQTLRRVLA
jgi:ribosomal protein S18 acetylase RimI-like enzyme